MLLRTITLLSIGAALPGAALAAGGELSDAARLEASPRHQEWVEVASGDRKIQTFVVYPAAKEKAPVVLLIHENRGLTDWVRGVAERLAEAGSIAVAPDLLSGLGPGGGRTTDFPSSDAAIEALYARDAEQVLADLDAVAAHARALPASNGKLAVAGFCWGGSQTFRVATRRSDLAGAFVFYGGAPEEREELGRIGCPVYGFYGGSDARVNAGIPAAEAAMRELGKTYEPVIYDGADHGFMRQGEEPEASEANRSALEAAWKRWLELLGTVL